MTGPNAEMTPGSREIGADFLKADVNPGERDRVNYAELRNLMNERFGADPTAWCFWCPTDEPFGGCGLVQSATTLEAFGPAAKEMLGRVCAGYFDAAAPPERRTLRPCRFTTLTPRGGPLSVVLRLDIGVSLKPSMRIAPMDCSPGEYRSFGVGA